ncbi:hypothetical protein C0Q70_02263 [Pomacea canaliculata]|uniref:Uncharacterized protein n=1 Tax=Pomacea canaliculata TaxID=400727 RepID=A0A2T7PPE8_POMCA|nr:hypothetical protein C0Q70_02263 [Pomacea canaliculata]
MTRIPHSRTTHSIRHSRTTHTGAGDDVRRAVTSGKHGGEKSVHQPGGGPLEADFREAIGRDVPPSRAPQDAGEKHQWPAQDLVGRRRVRGHGIVREPVAKLPPSLSTASDPRARDFNTRRRALYPTHPIPTPAYIPSPPDTDKQLCHPSDRQQDSPTLL